MDPNLLKGNLDAILLAILENGELYGGEITREAHARTNGYLEFKEGTLYPALHRLEKARLLESEFRYLPKGGAPVKFYRLTDRGARELAAKRREFARFNGAVGPLLGER